MTEYEVHWTAIEHQDAPRGGAEPVRESDALWRQLRLYLCLVEPRFGYASEVNANEVTGPHIWWAGVHRNATIGGQAVMALVLAACLVRVLIPWPLRLPERRIARGLCPKCGLAVSILPRTHCPDCGEPIRNPGRASVLTSMHAGGLGGKRIPLEQPTIGTSGADMPLGPSDETIQVPTTVGAR